MALEHVFELPGTGIRIGFEAEAGDGGQVQVMCDDEVVETFDAMESVMPPCCSRCIEDGAWVELDGHCPHGRMSYTRKVGLV